MAASGSMFMSGGLSKEDYLPHPFPLQRVGRTREAHTGGFVSFHGNCGNGNCRPKAHPDQPICPDRTFMSYGEWWEAHQPPPGPPPPEPDIKTFATNYWPYGRSITDVVTTDNKKDIYELDKRIVKNVLPYIPKRDTTMRTNYTGQLVMKRTDSVPGLMGSAYEEALQNRNTLTRAHSSATISTVRGPPLGHQEDAPPGRPEPRHPGMGASASFRANTYTRCVDKGSRPEWQIPVEHPPRLNRGNG